MKPEKQMTTDAPEQSIYLSIVVPLYNEEESFDNLVAGILTAAQGFAFTYEIILVDDGSTDNTWRCIERQKARVPHLRGIKFRRNFGQTAAMVAGFEHSRGRIIVTMDGDLQNDPADIQMLIDKMKEGYDIVSGWRKDRKDHWSRVLPSRVANWMISATTGVRLHDYGCSLKAYRADCIKPIKAYGDMHRFFPVLTSMTGARVAEVPVNHRARQYGTSKYGFNRIFKVLSDIFSIILIVKFSSVPLLGFALCALPFLSLGLFFSLLGVLAGILGWTGGKALIFTFSAGLSFLGMFHLVALGIIAEMAVAASDLSHTLLPQITGKNVPVSPPGDDANDLSVPMKDAEARSTVAHRPEQAFTAKFEESK
jgi:glycosyltransferase involved in cell wall biosynthesis